MPTVIVTLPAATILKNSPVTISATVTPDPAQTIVAYQWTVVAGTGSFASSTTGPTVVFVSDTAGPSTIQLQVSQSDAANAVGSEVITVIDTTVAMSPVMVNNVIHRMMDLNNSTDNSWNLANRGFLSAHAQSNGEVGGRLIIFQGAVPTIFPSTVSEYAADILVTYDATYWTSTNSINDFGSSVTTQNPVMITSAFVNATGTGTATWFMLVKSPLQGSNDFGTGTILGAIIGEVGQIGSGADLEIASTSLIAGQPYRIYNMRLQIPTGWTY